MPNNATTYKRYVIKPLRRIGAFIADLVLFMMISVSLYAVAISPLIKSFKSYKGYVSNQETAFNECKTILVDSHLVSYDENDKEVKMEDYFKSNMAFKLNDTHYDEQGHYTDIYLHFYVYYCGNVLKFSSAHKNYAVSWVNENIYHVNSENNYLFAVTDGNLELPLSFTDEAKKQLNNYLSGEVNGESQKYYDDYISLMKEQWEAATDLIIASDEYSLNAEIYNSNANYILGIYSYSAMIFFTVTYFLYYLLIPYLFKKGQTIAKKILHIGIYDDNNQPIKFTTLLFKSLILYFFMFFLVMFLPMMDLGLSIIYLPLFTISGYTFYLFFLAIVLLLLTITSGVCMCITKNHQALHDKMLNIFALRDNVNLDEEIDNRPSNVIEQENFDRGSSVQ